MFENEKLVVRTRSVPTAAALAILTGTMPRVLRRFGGECTFEWDSEHEATLRQYLRARKAIEKLAAEGGQA